MPATLVDITDPTISFPEFLVLDASVILELVAPPGSANQYHLAATNFLRRLHPHARRGDTLAIIPLPAFEECYFKICQKEIMDAAPPGVHWHQHYKNNPSCMTGVSPKLSHFYRLLMGFPFHITEPEDTAAKGLWPPLSVRIGEIMRDFLLLSKDANIFAEAERLGVKTVATLDRDWQRASGFTVITVI